MRFSRVALSYGPSDGVILPLERLALVSSPFVVKSIDGLEPPPIDVKINNGRFQSRKPANKEVVITLGLRPNYKNGETYSDLRDQLYNLLTPKFEYPVTLSLLDDDFQTVAYIDGHVKTMTPTIFVKEPDVQIVITCMGAYLLGSTIVLSNPTTYPTNPIVLLNPGNAPSGLKLKVTLNADSDNVTFSTGPFSKPFKLNTPFKSGDTITLSTEVGQRTATAYIDGVTVNVLKFITADSKWLELHGGQNELYLATTTNTSQFTLNSLSFVPRYWGV